jgi:nickel/cobalt transporter (NicO) family protein
MKFRRFARVGMIPLAVLAIILALVPSRASAHPLGNFTINRYAGLIAQPDWIVVDYVIDMAEIPAYQEITQQMGGGAGQTPAPAQADAYRARKCAELEPGLSLKVDGRTLPLALTDTALEFPPGAGGLPTLRLTCTFRSDLTQIAEAHTVDFGDANFAERIGWREIVVQGRGVEISDSNAPSASISNRLRAYPNDLINNPPRENAAHFSFTPSEATNAATTAFHTGSTLDRTQDAFAALITENDPSLPFMLLALLIAVGLGALHAASPGHGKTIMAAYLVGTRSTVTQALLLGMTVTVTHTLGVLALGVLTLFASRYILPETLYPWLSLISGVIVLGMGLSLAVQRWRLLQQRRKAQPHDHSHAHPHRHAASESYEHSHGFDDAAAELAHAHSHLPANFQAEGASWKTLVGLGLIGGIMPSASALIVLLAAISLQRIAFGLVLVIGFGVGMALVLVGTGFMLLRASHWLERWHTPARLLPAMPMMSALVVIGAGLFVTAQALVQLGVMRI